MMNISPKIDHTAADGRTVYVMNKPSEKAAAQAVFALVRKRLDDERSREAIRSMTSIKMVK